MVVARRSAAVRSQVLHLLAMARAAEVDLTIDDFQRISDATPFIADLKPSGRFVMEDVHKVSSLTHLWMLIGCVLCSCSIASSTIVMQLLRT